MEPIFVNGISVVAPGLVERDRVFSVLRGEEQWQAEPLPKFVLDMLPANERRRTTPTINLALQTIQPLFNSDENLEQIVTVFASSDGDLATDGKICDALSRSEKMVSPTLFSNSVHNAPAGYWAIAKSLRTNSVSLSAGNETFAAGLVDSITQIISERQNVLLVAYDVVAPEPLNSVRRFDYSLGLGIRLGLTRESESSGSISISLENKEDEGSNCLNKSLEPLRMGNPIGVGLPLMEALARKPDSFTINIPYLRNKQLQINYRSA
jgi:hypothetical protein